MKFLYISFAASLIAGVVAGEGETESHQGQSNNQPPANSDVVVGDYMSTLAMVGADSFSMIDSSGGRLLRGSGDARNLQGNGNGNGGCPPGLSTDLQEFPQWKDETGYWIGEYTLLQGDGTYNVNPNWPYPYDSYTGFITGNVAGNSYRQRNVFLYPPQTAEGCALNQNVVGDGVCGQNGNSLVFSADQSGCSSDGSIAGSFSLDTPFGSFQIDSTTELIGADNALLYQVFSAGQMTQSQLTTINISGNDVRRTRTAQSFSFGSGLPAGTSYYRELKVTKEEFYNRLQETITDYGISDSDLCVRDGFTRQPIPEYAPGGFSQCEAHLEQSFELV